MTYPEEDWERKFGYFNKSDLFLIRDRERRILKLLKNRGYHKEQDKYKVLDVGCGTANNLADFVSYGFLPENLFGIDIREEDLIDASRYQKHINLTVANGEFIPFPNSSFDIILAYTLFATILRDDNRAKVAGEMLRVLKKKGMILWFDMRLPNPFNPNVRKVTLRDIKKLFPDAKYHLKSSTLNPYITRITTQLSCTLTALLNSLPFLHTHLCGIIKKL